MSDPSRPKSFSMIRNFHLADWFTLGNAICGTGAIFSMMSFIQTTDIVHVYLAGGLVFVALLFDVLDGRIARWRRTHSAMGRELDSLADIISFGVAPAAIAYGCGMQGFGDRIVLAYFVACGVSRLARYNITTETMAEPSGKVRYFEGTPIPSSTVLVAVLLVCASVGAIGDAIWLGEIRGSEHEIHPLVLMFAISGSLMISRYHVPKL
jgi:CDP-diacylglycerol--serine O-phosphatidyltransferase